MASSSTPVKAWTYTSGGYPFLPHPLHHLVRVRACALNPVDIQLMNLPIWSLPYPSSLSAPKTPCTDVSGTLLADSPASGLKAGDDVFGICLNPFAGGTLCEVAHRPAAGTTVVKKPEAWTHTQAASLPLVWLTERTCIECVDPYVRDTPGKRLVVLGGSSATGMYTIFIAKARGWKVLTSCSGRNADFVTNTMGADEVVDYTVESVPNRVRAWKPDAIVVGETECLGIAKRYVTIVGGKTACSTMGGSVLYLLYPHIVL
jgi:NADPH:quinone reductase-like Zn-dependent oxidoreductase